jgi:hypothetical protein
VLRANDEAAGDADPAQVSIGEKLFLETRFARYFALPQRSTHELEPSSRFGSGFLLKLGTQRVPI